MYMAEFRSCLSFSRSLKTTEVASCVGVRCSENANKILSLQCSQGQEVCARELSRSGLCGCAQTMGHWLSLLAQCAWQCGVGVGRRDGSSPGNLMTSVSPFLLFRLRIVVSRPFCHFRSSLLRVLSGVS